MKLSYYNLTETGGKQLSSGFGSVTEDGDLG